MDWVSDNAVAIAMGTLCAGASLFLLRRHFSGGMCHHRAKLHSKVAIVTGANAGIGFETSKALFEMGATVILACRSMEKAERARKAIAKEVSNGEEERLVPMTLDLADRDSIKGFCGTFQNQFDALHILVNNAGVMALPTLQRTKHGDEMQLGTNHLGHFLLTTLLQPHLCAGSPSRVVVLSSRAHLRGSLDFGDVNFEKRPYEPWVAYCQSKLANAVFASELSRRWKHEDVSVYSVHPGVVRTNLGDPMIAAMPLWKKCAVFVISPVLYLVFKSPWCGAQTSIYACVAPDNEIETGAYLADCTVAAQHHPHVHDEGVGKKLWEWSEERVEGPQ